MKKLITEGNGYNIYKLDNIKKDLGSIYSDDKNNTFYYKDYQFKVWRINNDINGNPLYKFYLSKNFESVNAELKGSVYRCYISKGYSLLQSYNVGETINTIINKLENKENLK